MDALRASIGQEHRSKPAKKSKKTAAGEKEMLLQIEGKKAVKEVAAKKSSARSHRKSA